MRRSLIFIFSLLFLSMTLFLQSCAIPQEETVDAADFEDLKSSYEQILLEHEVKIEEMDGIRDENERIKKENIEKEKEITDLKEKVTELALQIEIIEAYSTSADDGLEGITPQKLRVLLDNMNMLLSHAYIGSSTAEQSAYTFTAFSIEYKGHYYIITAGHCVQDNYGEEGTFKFKANLSDEWIYPELLDYKAEFWNLDDYAVFYGGGIKSGLPVGDRKTPGKYLLGSTDKGLSIFRNLGDSSRRGESGSAVINEQMEAVGVYVVYGYVYTPIGLALDAIDKAVIN